MSDSLPLADATVAGRRVRFVPTYREGEDTPPVVELSLTTPLALEDIVALCWQFFDTANLAELTGEFIDRMLPEVLLDQGGDIVMRVRDEVLPRIDRDRPQPTYDLLTALRHRVLLHYG